MTVSYKDAEYPLQAHRIMENDVLEFDDFENPVVTITQKVMSDVVNLADEIMVKAIVKYAEKEGFSHAYLLDKTFVTNALLHELERWEEDNKDV